MTHCILFLLGLVILWIGVKAADDVHRLAFVSTAFFPLSWGYFSSPVLFQSLSAITLRVAFGSQFCVFIRCTFL